jgi:site-specific recombinase XerD
MGNLVRVRTTSYWTPAPNSRKCSKAEACIVDASGKAILKPGFKRKREKSAKFYGRVNGRMEALHEDKDVAEQMLARKIREHGMAEQGITDPYREHRKRPLAEHVEDFRKYLLNKGNTQAYVGMTYSRVLTLVKGCRFERIGDVSASRVAAYLADRRRHGLGQQTSNFYLTAVKAFCRWLVQDRRTNENPLAHLQGGNVKLDRRHDRRNLSPEEINRLLDAAACSTDDFRGLTGQDRYYLYAVALGTGFRAAELASLTRASFQLAANPPVARVQAGYSKNRKEAAQPLASDLAVAIADYVADMPKDGRVWPGTWTEKAANMLRADLAAARLAWLKEAKTPEEQEQRKASTFLAYRDEEGRCADFHSLRHSFITSLTSGGVHPKVAQVLARHSSITLTLDRYSHLGMVDVEGALDVLPRLPVALANGSAEMKATGTDDSPLVERPLPPFVAPGRAGVSDASEKPLPPFVARETLRLSPACRAESTS